MLELDNSSNTLLNDRERERRIDPIGKKRLLSGNYKGLRLITLSDLKNTLSGTPSRNTMYVIGHDHPDADSVASAVFEAVRRNLAYLKQNCLPWAPSVPPEVADIVGHELAERMVSSPALLSYHSVVFVDCQHFDGINQSQIKGIVDHHHVNSIFPEYVAVSSESSWSTSLQIYIKILGSGFDLDSETSRILAEATTLEAESQLMHRRLEINRLALARLKERAGPSVREYRSLLELMMVETDPLTLFYKDYRQTPFGFSVVHCKEYINMIEIAQKKNKNNNLKHRLPVSVIKQILAKKDAPLISSERITLVFNDHLYDKGFRNAAVTVAKEECEAFTTRNSPLRVFALSWRISKPKLQGFGLSNILRKSSKST